MPVKLLRDVKVYGIIPRMDSHMQTMFALKTTVDLNRPTQQIPENSTGHLLRREAAMASAHWRETAHQENCFAMRKCYLIYLYSQKRTIWFLFALGSRSPGLSGMSLFTVTCVQKSSG